MLGVMTTALATTNAKVDKLKKRGATQMVTQVKQPGPRCPSAMENVPLTAAAAVPDKVDVEEQVWLWATHHIRAP